LVRVQNFSRSSGSLSCFGNPFIISVSSTDTGASLLAKIKEKFGDHVPTEFDKWKLARVTFGLPREILSTDLVLPENGTVKWKDWIGLERPSSTSSSSSSTLGSTSRVSNSSLLNDIGRRRGPEKGVVIAD
jgi:hypothetical protein